MPYYNNNSNSYRTYTSNNSYSYEPNILNAVYYPYWDTEVEEKKTQDILDNALNKKVLTRKLLNNAFEYVYKDNHHKLQEVKANRKPMREHVREGNLLDVKQYIDSGYDLFKKEEQNFTLTHIAAFSKNPLPMLKLLLDNGAPIDPMNDHSKTPFLFALGLGIGMGQYPRQLWDAANYLLDRGALLLPYTLTLLPHNVMEDRMKDILKGKFGKEEVSDEEKREYLTTHGKDALNSYFGALDLYYRILDLEDTYLRTLHFTNLASNETRTLTLDERASIRLLKEYVKYWFLRSNAQGDVDLLVKEPKGKPDRVLDPTKTIKEEGLTEDTVIKIVPRLKTYANVWGGKRRRAYTRKSRK